jgi:flagellar biosynthetic protein FlhB
MAEQQQEQDKTEPATPFKLKEAKKRGQVFKSMEANSLLILVAGLMVMFFAGERLAVGQLAMSKALFESAHTISWDAASTLGWFELTFTHMLSIFWPVVGAVMLAAVVGNLLQTGPVFSFFPLKPDVQRLNPVQGFKRLFSTKLLFESIKTVVKLGLFALVIFFALEAMMPMMMGLLDRDPNTYAPFLLVNTAGLAFKLLLVLLLVALVDLAYSRWDFNKRMRMSRREVKEETKRREGDPLVRSRIRQLQKEAVKRAGALKRVPDADVLITNPVHLAVALRYERDCMNAPQVTAKGAGRLAGAMRALARKHRVPVVENPELARELFKRVELEQPIPEDAYPAVAQILMWVYRQREGQAAADGAVVR